MYCSNKHKFKTLYVNQTAVTCDEDNRYLISYLEIDDRA
jgi:hypothetical protein